MDFEDYFEKYKALVAQVDTLYEKSNNWYESSLSR